LAIKYIIVIVTHYCYRPIEDFGKLLCRITADLMGTFPIIFVFVSEGSGSELAGDYCWYASGQDQETFSSRLY